MRRSTSAASTPICSICARTSARSSWARTAPRSAARSVVTSTDVSTMAALAAPTIPMLSMETERMPIAHLRHSECFMIQDLRIEQTNKTVQPRTIPRIWVRGLNRVSVAVPGVVRDLGDGRSNLDGDQLVRRELDRLPVRGHLAHRGIFGRVDLDGLAGEARHIVGLERLPPDREQVAQGEGPRRVALDVDLAGPVMRMDRVETALGLLRMNAHVRRELQLRAIQENGDMRVDMVGVRHGERAWEAVDGGALATIGGIPARPVLRTDRRCAGQVHDYRRQRRHCRRRRRRWWRRGRCRSWGRSRRIVGLRWVVGTSTTTTGETG